MRIQISSHFQRGGRLQQWDGKKLTTVARASENTWHDDGDSSVDMEISDTFKGVVTTFYGASWATYVSRVRDWIGFADAELSAPSPVSGWASKAGGIRCSNDWRLETVRDYISALATGASIRTDAELIAAGKVHPESGNVLVHLGYERGDQAADAWAVFAPSGELLTKTSGCGDVTPEPVETGADWSFTCPREEQVEDERAEREERAERFEAHCLAIERALA